MTDERGSAQTAGCEVAPDALALIGNTPLVALDRIDPAVAGRVLAKAEFLNPTGSFKDRCAAYIIAQSLARGDLSPERPVIELTSGNMGTSLAMVCRLHGLRFIAVMSAGNSRERAQMMRALGAEVVLVPQADGSRPGQVSGEDLALAAARCEALVEETGGFRVNQFHNPDNVAAAEALLGPEIWRQTGGRVDALVAAVGTGCSYLGTMKYLRRQKEELAGYVVEPAGAAVIAGCPVTCSGHSIQGIGYSQTPPQWEPGLCDGSLAVSDAEALDTARRLAATEGLFCGYSAGANVAGALRLAHQRPDLRCIVTLLCDSGMKYLSCDLAPAD